MNEQHIHDAIGELSEEILAPVAKLRQKKRHPIAPWVAAAACLCLLLCLPKGVFDTAKAENAVSNAAPEMDMDMEDHFYGATMDKVNVAMFRAKILEMYDGTVLVEPLEGERELLSADKFHVSLGHLQDLPEMQVGDILEITYDGLIMESYPCQITGTISVKVVG